jgi:hypothetical protein
MFRTRLWPSAIRRRQLQGLREAGAQVACARYPPQRNPPARHAFRTASKITELRCPMRHSLAVVFAAVLSASGALTAGAGAGAVGAGAGIGGGTSGAMYHPARSRIHQPLAPGAEPAPSLAQVTTSTQSNPPSHLGGNNGTSRQNDTSGSNAQSPPGSAVSGSAAGSAGVGSAPAAYAECMARWNPATTQLSREEWSRTCHQAGVGR